MASIGRKEPAAPPQTTREQPKPKPRPAAAGSGGTRPSTINRLRTNIDNISSELRKVTWPTREETRNLTIVVLGISAAVGLFLGGLDQLLAWLYNFLDSVIQ